MDNRGSSDNQLMEEFLKCSIIAYNEVVNRMKSRAAGCSSNEIKR